MIHAGCRYNTILWFGIIDLSHQFISLSFGTTQTQHIGFMRLFSYHKMKYARIIFVYICDIPMGWSMGSSVITH